MNIPTSKESFDLMQEMFDTTSYDSTPEETDEDGMPPDPDAGVEDFSEGDTMLDQDQEQFLDDYLSIALRETFSKPGTADVTPSDRAKLKGLLAHYGKMKHPFTSCKADQIKHGLSEDHANRRCAVLKDLIKGTTKWRGKGKDASEEDIEALVLTETDEYDLDDVADFIANISDYDDFVDMNERFENTFEILDPEDIEANLLDEEADRLEEEVRQAEVEAEREMERRREEADVGEEDEDELLEEDSEGVDESDDEESDFSGVTETTSQTLIDRITYAVAERLGIDFHLSKADPRAVAEGDSDAGWKVSGPKHDQKTHAPKSGKTKKGKAPAKGKKGKDPAKEAEKARKKAEAERKKKEAARKRAAAAVKRALAAKKRGEDKKKREAEAAKRKAEADKKRAEREQKSAQSKAERDKKAADKDSKSADKGSKKKVAPSKVAQNLDKEIEKEQKGKPADDVLQGSKDVLKRSRRDILSKGEDVTPDEVKTVVNKRLDNDLDDILGKDRNKGNDSKIKGMVREILNRALNRDLSVGNINESEGDCGSISILPVSMASDQSPHGEETLAYQLPADFAETKRYGRQLWWKRVLKYGKIFHPKGPNGELQFDKPYAESLVQNFNEGAFEQVPLFHVNEENKHNSHPENVRGWVQRVEARDDGLYALVETNPKGTEYLEEDNPNVGVSVRIVPEYERPEDKRKFGDALEHLAITTKAHLGKLGAWIKPKEVALSEDSLYTTVMDFSAEEMVDFMAHPVERKHECFAMLESLMHAYRQAKDPTLSTAIAGLIRQVLDKAEQAKKDNQLTEEDYSELRGMAFDFSEEMDRDDNQHQEVDLTGNALKPGAKKKEIEARIAELEGKDTLTDEEKTELEGLKKKLKFMSGGNKDASEEGRDMIDFANLSEEEKAGLNQYIEAAVQPYKDEAEKNKQAAIEALKLNKQTTRELAEERLTAKLNTYADAGVPPASLESAKAILLSEKASDVVSVDLSADGTETKKTVADFTWAMLENQKGTAPVQHRIPVGTTDLAETDSDEDEALWNQFTGQVGDFSQFQSTAQ